MEDGLTYKKIFGGVMCSDETVKGLPNSFFIGDNVHYSYVAGPWWEGNVVDEI